MSIRYSSRLVYFNVALLSGVALAYEILLLRVFSIVQWHHFAYMVISLALLGYSAGGTLLMLAKKKLSPSILRQHYFHIVFAASAAFSLFMWLGVNLAQSLDLNPQELLWYAGTWFKLMTIYITLAVPFLFVSVCILLSFLCFPDAVSKIYAADLAGAGLGCLLIFVLMSYFAPEIILLVLVVVAAVAAIIYLLIINVGTKTSIFALSVILAALLLIHKQDYRVEVSQYKALAQAMRTHGAELRARLSGPLGEISIVANSKIPLRHAPGLSLYSNAEIPEQLAIFVDGEGPSPIIHWDGRLDSLSYLKDMLSSAVYQIRPVLSSYLIGLGGGSNILQAKVNGVKKIDVVELNPQIIELHHGDYSQYNGNLLQTAGVESVNSDARAYLASSAENYDLIKMGALNSLSASSAGLFSLSENYLLTVESLKLYILHLSPEGMLSIDQWLNVPAKASLKLFAMSLKALHELGVPHPERHLMLMKSLQTSSLIVSKSPLQEPELENARAFCDAKGFSLVYPINANAASTMQTTELAPQQIFDPNAVTLLNDYKFDISPATDDKPYFNHYFKWSSLPELLRLKEQGGYSMLENGYLLLLAALIQAIILGALLIFPPLIGKSIKESSNGIAIKVFIYFTAIGLGFFFVEIAFIQKTSLLFGHPVLATSIVIAAFLLFSALGSNASSGETGVSIKKTILRLLLLLLLAAVVLNWIPEIAGSAPIEIKYLLVILIIAPLAFYMGKPLPLAIGELMSDNEKWVSWAWSVNGAASVMSSVLATLFAIQWGISRLLVIAGLLYLGCIVFFPHNAKLPGNR